MSDPLGLFSNDDPLGLFDDDPVKQIPGMENSVPSDSNLNAESSILDKVRGVVEAGATAVTGLPAAVIGAAGGLGNDKRAGEIAQYFTYQPRTEKGQEYAGNVGEFANQLMNPLLGHMGNIHTEPFSKRKLSTEEARRAAFDKAQADAKAAPAADPLGLFTDLKATEGENGQMALFDIPESGRMPNPTEAVLGDWRIDENGIPVKADLSMEAANTEGLLQKNLWGDELAPKHEQEQLPISQAMDATREAAQKAEDLPMADAQRGVMNEQIELLKGELDAPGELKTAVMDANNPLAGPGTGGDRSPLIVPRGQRGAINPEVFKEGFEKLKQLAGGSKLRAYGTGDQLKIEYLTKDGKQLGEVRYDAVDHHFIPSLDFESYQKLDASAEDSFVDGLHRGKGIATQIYKFASELGNDVRASDMQTVYGKMMWEKFHEKGLAKDGVIRSPGNKQGGAIQLKEIEDAFRKPGEVQPIKTQPSSAEQNLRNVLKQDARSHVGRFGAPVWSPGNRQMGAIRLGERKQRQLEKVVGKQDNMIPKNPDPHQAVEEALLEGKDSNQWNYTESGGTLAAMKRKSVAVLAASRMVQNAEKRADLNIRENVFPVEKALRGLSRDEVETLMHVIKTEMLSNERSSVTAIEALSVKQQAAYAHFRSMMDDTLRIQNEGRAAENKPPITGMEAYASSRWNGDFRRPIFQTILDAAGNPKINPDGSLASKQVWYLAAHSKKGVANQTAALLKDHPDLTFDPKKDHVVRYYKRQTDLQSVYSTMLDILGRDDPAVAKLKAAIEEQTVNEAASFLAQEKHFKEKTGVRGFVGDRPGKGGLSESLAFFQQQVQYAKNAYKWSEIQKSAQDLKTIVSDPRLVEQQPNNVKYIKEYVKNAVGYGEARAVAHLEDAIRDINLPFSGNISPTVIANALGATKSYFVLSKLAVSAGYTIANLFQTMNVLPHLALEFSKGNHGNPLSAMAVGISGGIAMATGHYANFFSPTVKGAVSRLSTTETNFLMKAFKYAEDNGVTARSIYDEAPIESSFSTIGKVGTVAGKTLSVSETFVRSIAYMTFVEFLRSSGKFAGREGDLFQKAEELVNASMVDYRAGERPMVFSKLGMMGDFANTLQTYPMNWYNQWNLMGREAAAGNLLPIATMLGVQYVVAGAMGVPGFDDAIKLYDYIKDNLTDPVMYQKMQESKFWSNPKMFMMEKLGQPSVYGVLSDKSGIGLTSRAAAPGAGQMLQAPFGPAIDLAKQAGQLGSAVLDPTNKTKWGQAGMSILPPGVQGLLETAPGMEGTTFDKRQRADGTTENVYGRPGAVADHKAVYARTPQEETLRKFGLRSQKETVEREIGYRTDKDNQVAATQARNIPNAFYDAVKRGNKPQAQALFKAYTKLTGQGISDAQLEAQIRDNYLTTIERSSMAAKSVIALQNIGRMKALLQQIREENGK